MDDAARVWLAAVDPATIGLVGGAIGAVLGGGFGAFALLRSADTPAVRAFYWKVAVLSWVLLVGLFVGLAFAPRPYRILVLAVWLALQWILLKLPARLEERIRREDAERTGR